MLDEVEGTVGVITPVRRRGEVAGWLRDRAEGRLQVVTSLEAKGMEYDGVVLVEPGADPGRGIVGRTHAVRGALPGHPAPDHGRHGALAPLTAPRPRADHGLPRTPIMAFPADHGHIGTR